MCADTNKGPSDAGKTAPIRVICKWLARPRITCFSVEKVLVPFSPMRRRWPPKWQAIGDIATPAALRRSRSPRAQPSSPGRARYRMPRTMPRRAVRYADMRKISQESARWSIAAHHSHTMPRVCRGASRRVEIRRGASRRVKPGRARYRERRAMQGRADMVEAAQRCMPRRSRAPRRAIEEEEEEEEENRERRALDRPRGA